MEGHSDQSDEPDEHNAASGELTGLAQDQNTTYVQVDVELRRATNREQPTGPRQLRDIVRFDRYPRMMVATHMTFF